MSPETIRLAYPQKAAYLIVDFDACVDCGVCDEPCCRKEVDNCRAADMPLVGLPEITFEATALLLSSLKDMEILRWKPPMEG
jgi:hypothetical protein